MFDEHMNLESHVKNLRCSCFKHLNWISEIRKYITADAAARVITRTRKFDSITPFLKELHWLPVHKRIIFKLLVLTYRSIRGTAPQYLSSLLHSHQPPRTLRSAASQALLTVDRTRLDTYGSRAFSVAGPAFCNELPHAIKCAETLSSFMSQLKKHLFCQAFNVGL